PRVRRCEISSGQLPWRATRELGKQGPHWVILERAAEPRAADERQPVPWRQRDPRRARLGEIAVQTERQRDVEQIEDAAELGLDARSHRYRLLSRDGRRRRRRGADWLGGRRRMLLCEHWGSGRVSVHRRCSARQSLGQWWRRRSTGGDRL